MSLIRLRKVSKRYGADLYALRDVDPEIEEGEWVVVMGPSGSGKSTLLNMVGLLDRPSSGDVVLAGTDVTALAKPEITRVRRETIGLVFQQFHLIPYLTALENVMLAQYYHSMADEAEAREALGKVGLLERASHLPHQLSGGEQQRVCVARALINHPKILLADEPTGNLDATNQTLVLHLFQKLHEEGHTIVMVTHDPEISRFADRRVRLAHGRLATVNVTPEQASDQIDEVLEQLFIWSEDVLSARGILPAADGTDCHGNPPASAEDIVLPDVADKEEILRLMTEVGLLRREDGGWALTDPGRNRGRDIVRRHRLAEKLLEESFEMPEALSGREACRFEHILSREVTNTICTFLAHPTACPHGKPIPTGECCVSSTVSAGD